MKNNQLIYLHILYWIINLLGTVIIPEYVYTHSLTILNSTFFITSFICFYVNYFFVVPKFFNIHQLYKTIVGFFISVSCFVVIRYFVEEVFLLKIVGTRNYAEGTNFGYYFFDNIYYSSSTIFISTVFGLIHKFFQAEQEKNELLAEKKNAELQALKTQINPHFIFNALNNIYSLVYQNSTKSLPAIEKLSQLLRYSTKDLEKNFIPLVRELGYFESLIELEKLRIKNPELIVVEKNIQNESVEISPMLLVPFIENAFKHGDFNGKGFELNCTEKNNQLHFYLMNFKKSKTKDSTSGIGIENVKKRLQLIYPNKHQLKINETDHSFEVDLKIILV